MNCIGHQWNKFGRRMKKDQSNSKKELKEALTRVRNDIEVPVFEKLVNLVPNRLHEVMKMKRFSTRY